ncbi:MAG: hypothetical protein HUK40_04950 [Desulfobacter sp.]|nr:hypothetical protein [Desulfobacter sp.]
MAFCFLAWPGSGAAAKFVWQTLETRYLILHFQRDSDLEKFDRKIEPVKHIAGFKKAALDRPDPGKYADLVKKMDSLVEKVQLILDMRKPMQVNIRIYPDRQALQNAHLNLYKKGRAMWAWYLYEYNTIYVNVDDLFSGMLAHEIAHAVIDHYLEARPPRATAEILARYVDAHLNEQAKVY